ncbi:fam-l protein [Plasmodium brasilianum]|uniref:fam-l protein n=1 Tax=Plasmodium brasilianum TaxID=5824 RepID=UPI00350E4919|nr:fam-l protein [Plasmodium brasilianum]
MEQKIKSLLFIKIATFIILSWIYHFYHDVETFRKYFIVKYMYDRKLYMRNYRSLAKFEKDKDSNIAWLKEKISNNGMYENKDICYNEMRNLGKSERSNINSGKKFWGLGLVSLLCYVLKTIKPGCLSQLQELLKMYPFKEFFESIDTINVPVGKSSKDVHFYVTGFFGIFIYLLPFILFGVTLILKVVYYHKKVKKYEKIKFRKR